MGVNESLCYVDKVLYRITLPAKAVCCHVVRLKVFNLLAHIFHYFDNYFLLISLFTIYLINLYYKKKYSLFFNQ